MASPDLAVAKASLSATLFRADPTSCSRDDIDQLFSLLGSTVTRCSPANVQKCKQWILRNLVQSSSRVAPFGKYLVALANSLTPDKAKAKQDAGPFAAKTAQLREPSVRRQRLHILYILNDVFYHVKFRGPDDGFHAKFEPFLPPLVRAASDFLNSPKHIRKIHDLIGLWDEEAYFTKGTIPKLRAAVEQDLADESAKNGSEDAGKGAKVVKDQPFVMPAMHGDPTTPWYDLPAGNWLTALEPNSTRPMNPSMIKPLQLAPGPADKNLVEAVKKLLVEVDNIYAADVSHIAESSMDVDQMGEHVELDEITGDIIGGETYYGWSRAFCEKMKSRRRKTKDGGSGRGRSSRSSLSGRSFSRSRTPDRSRSSSRVAMKRRRISASPDERGGRRSRSRSRDSRRRRSWSSRGSSRSRSRSPSRTRTHGQRESNRGRSGSPRYSPPPPMPDYQNGNGRGYHQPFNQQQQAPPPPAPYGLNQFPLVPPPLPPGHGAPPMPPHPAFGGFQGPVPPPPPPNYQGQWPPPPPPPPPMGVPPQNFFPGGSNMGHQFPGGWPVPPQQQQHPQQQNQYQYGGRGGGNFRGGGRGGYGRGGW